MANIVPYRALDLEMLPQSQAISTPRIIQGVHIVASPEMCEWLAPKIAGWFAGREGIELVDVGVSDKQGTGYLILEWDQREIDPLFLAILRDEESILDYTTYIRDLEV